MKKSFYQTIPDEEQQVFKPAYFGKLDQNISTIQHHRIPIYQQYLEKSKQTLPKIKRTMTLQMRPNQKIENPIRMPYIVQGNLKPLITAPTLTLPPIVSPSVISARATPIYASPQLIPSKFTYIQPYQNKFTLPVTNKINYKIIKKF